MRIVLLISFLFMLQGIYSQNDTLEIKGIVKLEEENGFFENPAVYVESLRDSSIERYGNTDAEGFFSVKYPVSKGAFNIIISHPGYQKFKQPINTTQDLFLDTIYLKLDDHILELVTIQTEAIPMIIKDDTVEFNVGSFETFENASTIDLLKELPGFDLDADGKVLFNGKPVDKVLINGQAFYGQDFIAALQNLPKDALAKIQVTTSKTKSEAFTNDPGDQKSKTLNLIVKEEYTNTYFGNLAAGIGTTERFELDGTISHISKNDLINVYGKANNTNAGSFETSSGLITSQDYGLNYTRQINDKLDVEGHYVFSGQTSENETLTERENFLPGSSFFTNSNALAENTGNNHSIRLGVDIKASSTLLINITPSIAISKGSNLTENNQKSLNDDNTLINEQRDFSFAEDYNQTIDNNITVTKKIGVKGAVLKFDLAGNISTAKKTGNTSLFNEIFADTAENISREQLTDGKLSSTRFKTRASYKLPLIKDQLFLTTGLDYLKEDKKDRYSTFDQENDGEESIFNPIFSQDFNFISEMTSPNLELTLKRSEWSTSLKVDYTNRLIENEDFLRPQFNAARNFQTFGINYHVNFRINSTTSINGGYSLNNVVPNLAQLIPFENQMDPLNIIRGNPDLNVQKNHNFSLNLTSFSLKKGQSFFSSFYLNLVNDQVVSKATIGEDLVRETTFVNVDGGYQVFANIRYKKKIRLDSLLALVMNVAVSPSANRMINFNNDIRYSSDILSLSPKVKANIIWTRRLNIGVQYQINMSRVTYDLADGADQNLIRHKLDVSSEIQWMKRFKWYNEVAYLNNGTTDTDIQNTNLLWSTSLSCTLLSNKAELSLTVFDVLGGNTNISQAASLNYIENTQSTVLQRYFMLKFSWKFNGVRK